MTTLDKLKEKMPVRLCILGYPGAGKTGALACLANAGFKLRILDYDGNLEPLVQYTKPECLKNIEVAQLKDKFRSGQKTIEPVGIPDAFSRGFKLMDNWKYKDGDTEVDFGKSKDWGRDTIVVLDSLTSMGDASYYRAMALSNKTQQTMTDAAWGLAMKEQEGFIRRLMDENNPHHTIVLSHLKMITPRTARKGDDDLTIKIKNDIGELVPTRLFPSALGWALPQDIGKHFPVILMLETIHGAGGRCKRVFRSVPRPELDLKYPVLNPDTSDKLGVDDGLLKVFDALTGGIDNCLKETP